MEMVDVSGVTQTMTGGRGPHHRMGRARRVTVSIDALTPEWWQSLGFPGAISCVSIAAAERCSTTTMRRVRSWQT